MVVPMLGIGLYRAILILLGGFAVLPLYLEARIATSAIKNSILTTNCRSTNRDTKHSNPVEIFRTVNLG